MTVNRGRLGTKVCTVSSPSESGTSHSISSPSSAEEEISTSNLWSVEAPCKAVLAVNHTALT
jgi:hypothetical protein